MLVDFLRLRRLAHAMKAYRRPIALTQAMTRFLYGIVLAVALLAADAMPEARAQTALASFDDFLRELWPDAQAQGITRATFDKAFAGLTPDARVIALTRRQPEYGKPIGAYIDSFVSASNIATGARKAAELSATLDVVEKKFGVERWIVLAIWAVETAYGAEKERWDVVRSLATLAQARYRDPYFRNELLVALKILQDEGLPRDKMMGSWAGAMGQPQFMPSSFLTYAVDLSGEGRRDIWTNIPDVLGSIANYLQKWGWKRGVPWGFEVVVPNGFDYQRSRAPFATWNTLGIRRADGAALPSTGDAILFFPSGAAGPAFLVTENFVAIKQYNNSDAYALAVAHLADRLHGRPPFRAAWPPNDQQLSREARIALQRRLAELGYDVHDFEGRIDFDLRDAIRKEQIKFAILPDGHPTALLLARLGVKTP
jgi:membrane-bound lytic murein transglycosylase B